MATIGFVRSDEKATGSGGAFVTPGYVSGFILVCSLFFLWAIAANFNDLLVRQFQKALALDRLQAGLVQFVFYIGYFTMALPAGLLMRRFGYRAGIVTGLLLYALGAVLFYPAAQVREYWLFLTALYVISAGTSFLETAANPYAIAMGDPRRGAMRANFAQSFNGLGVFVAPLIGARFIFSGVEHSAADLAAMSPEQVMAFRVAEAHMVQFPYLVLAGVILLIALAFTIVRLPDLGAGQKAVSGQNGSAFSVLREPTLIKAMIALFFYMGGQIGIWSFFIDLVKDLQPSASEREAAYLLSLSFAIFMIGRFIGTACLSRMRADRLLLICAMANAILCGAALLTSGWVAIACIGMTSFFLSIMFPTIFSFGVRDLGDRAMVGSSFIVMAMIGGAVLPPLMGLIDKTTGSLQFALVLPLGCFLVVAGYAASLAKQALEGMAR